MFRQYPVVLMVLLGGLSACAPADVDPDDTGQEVQDSGYDSPGSGADGGLDGGLPDAGGDTGPTPVMLQDGAPHGPLAGSAGTGLLFRLQVSSTHRQLEVVTSGGTGNVDLYLRFGKVVTIPTATCTSTQAGNEERCLISLPQGGAWFILVQGVTDFSGVKVTATASTPPNPPNALESGVPLTGLSSDGSAPLLFTLEVPAHQRFVDFTAKGGTGNASMYVKALSAPTTSQYDCYSIRSGNSENCILPEPAVGTWHVMLTGVFQGLTLTGTAIPWPAPTALVSGVPVSVNTDEYFALDVPADDQVVRFTLASGYADLYVARNRTPTATDADCRFVVSQVINKVCELTGLTAGQWIVRVKSPSTTLTLTGTHYSQQTLSNAVPVNGISGDAGTRLYYKLNVPVGKTSLVVRLSGDVANATVRVARDAPPSNTALSCATNGDSKQCSISAPAAGTYWIVVSGTGAFSGASLTATFSPPSEAEALALTNGIPLHVTGQRNELKLFKFEVPPGVARVDFDVLPFRGDFYDFGPATGSLLLKHGAVPNASDDDCQHGCTLVNPAAGTWYLLLSNSSSSHDTVLRANTSGVVPFIMNGIVEDGDRWVRPKALRLEVPAGASDLVVKLEGWAINIQGTLTVKRPDGSTACNRTAANPSCLVASPAPGTWSISIDTSETNSAGLTAKYLMSPGEDVPALTNGVTLRNIKVQNSQGKYLFWKLEVPEGQDVLSFALSGGGPQLSANLMTVQRGVRPTASNHVCNTNACLFSQPEPGTWFVRVELTSDETRGLQLTGSYYQTGEVWELKQGQPIVNLLGSAQSRQYWKIEVPAGQASLTFTDNHSYAIKYVKYGGLPEGTAAERCDSRCSITNPQAGTWYVLLTGDGTHGFSQVMLSGFYSTTADDGVALLADDVEVHPRAGQDEPLNQLFKIYAPPGTTHFGVDLLRPVETNASNYTWLIVRKGAPPETGLYDCYYDAPFWSFGSCNLDATEGWYYVRVSRQAPIQAISVDMLPRLSP